MVGPGEHYVAPRHAPALGHECFAEVRRHVLERVEGGDDVE